MTFDELILRRTTDQVTAEDYVAWAVSALVDGLDSPSLRILAGLNLTHEREDIEPCFAKCAAELGLQPGLREPSPRDTAMLVRRLFEVGTLSPEETIGYMATLYQTSGYSDPLFRIWFDIEEDLSLGDNGPVGVFYPTDALTSLDAATRTEWRLFDRAIDLKPPDGYLAFVRCEDCDSIGLPRQEPVHRQRRFWQPKRPLVVRHVCEVCGSERHRSMSDPAVRTEYFNRLAMERSEETS